MATRTTKSRKRRPTDDELVAMIERMAPSKSKLRRLVKKYPAPQEWYDQDDSAPKQTAKKK